MGKRVETDEVIGAARDAALAATKRADAVLHYVGYRNTQGDGEYIPGVPARDLTQADIDERGLDVSKLVKSGLYVKAKAAKPKSKESEVS